MYSTGIETIECTNCENRAVADDMFVSENDNYFCEDCVEARDQDTLSEIVIVKKPNKFK